MEGCSCELRFLFSSAKEAREAKAALGKRGPESTRSSAKALAKGKELVVGISATDPVALRAAVNSCLRGIKIIDDVKVSLNEQQG